MKGNACILFALLVLIIACNNDKKDSVEKADSANKAYLDTAITHNLVVLDEESSSFLVKAANLGMSEMQLASLAQQKAVSQPVKDFSSMQVRDYSVLNNQVKNLAAQMPDSITDDKQKQIIELTQKNGLNFDKTFMQIVIKNYEEIIDLYEKALLNKKDPDINSFADKTLMTLHMHLNSAKNIRPVIK